MRANSYDLDFLQPFLDARRHAERRAHQADKSDRDTSIALLYSALAYLGSALRMEHATEDIKVTRKGNVIYPAIWSKKAKNEK